MKPGFAPDTKITNDFMGLRVVRARRKAFAVSTLK